MFINSEILKYAASIIISFLSFLLIRALRFGDKLEERMAECEKDIVEIKAKIGSTISHSANA